MAHRNARLAVCARRLLVARVVGEGRPVAHVVDPTTANREARASTKRGEGSVRGG
ncbi:leucine zipper domain-containing protein [Micromonospora lupini]